MENATQALKIAAGVLMALLILSLLVFFYNSMQDWFKHEENLTSQEQSANFNKEYEIYIRNLYGSELLSLVNKVDNYNNIEVTQKGYSRLDVVITFKSDIGGFKKNKAYTTDTIISIINTLQSKIESYGNIQYGGKKVSELALMRTNELQQFIADKGLNKSPDKTSQIQENIKKYTEAKADEVTIKSKTFKYISSSYDSATGRMKQIKYKES